ncbi:MAG: hypothetical protein NC243_02370 [Lachnoclostridium sp.]|nr:hypothetical protein [Lachnoclostridium sp.]
MLFVLAGPSYVGKKTALSHFMKLYSFSSIIPYTTKPVERRIGEVEGIKYHYVAQEDSGDIKNENFIYDTPFQYNDYTDTVLYAYKKLDIENAINSYANFIIHASVGNAMQIYDQYHEKHIEHLFVIFLDYQSRLTKEYFKEKFISMGTGVRADGVEEIQINESEFMRRYNHAMKEQKTYQENKGKFDIYLNADHKYDICEKLEKEVLPKLMVMPTSPDRIPGALSDVDIIYMCEKRKNDALDILVDGKKMQGDELKEVLCECGVQLTLSSTIRLIKRNILHRFVDMASSETELDVQLAKLYPEQNISTGYILKPNETILCSSEEKIKVPHDVYAVVSSKFSYTQLGLSIEFGTSIIQAGHRGRVHFQIKNNTENSICIYPHIQVVQLLFFRTVQPSSRKYNEGLHNHLYDGDSIPPISRFRKNNENLSNVSKPVGNLLKSILLDAKTKVITEVLGFLAVIALLIFNAAKYESLLDSYIVPFVKKSPTLMKCVIIAVVGCVLTHLFNIVGKLLIWGANKILMLFRRLTR